MRTQICEKMLGKFRVTYSIFFGTSLKTRSVLGTHEHAKFDGNFDNCGEPSRGFRRLAQPCGLESCQANTSLRAGKNKLESSELLSFQLFELPYFSLLFLGLR